MKLAFSADGKSIISDRSMDELMKMEPSTATAASLQSRDIKYDSLTGKRIGTATPSESDYLNTHDRRFAILDKRLVRNAHAARLRNPDTDEMLGVPMRHRNLSLLKFSPNGERVLTGSGNCIARLWDASEAPQPRQRIEWFQLLLGKRFNPADEASAVRDANMAALSDNDVSSFWETLRQEPSWLDAMSKYQVYLATLPKWK